jgi:stearoyl-CoA desaturase (delta-9 desaturase)
LALIDHILQEPSYGWADKDGKLVIPTKKQLVKEAFSRINIFKSKKNWISLIGWFMIICMMPFFYIFITRYFSWQLFLIMLVYGMVVMGTHGTIWFHRYCTHRAYKFSHPVWRFITQNLVIKTIPEEVYVISHHVHHSKSDLPGDPYNSRAGLAYCLFADVNHQGVSKNLSEKDYHRATRFMEHTGVKLNSYKQYLKWGSLASPLYTIAVWLLNWAAWYTILYFIGGHGLATALFSSSMLWFMGVRIFNYTGHGKGEEKFVDGLDFDRSNLAVNQSRPGMLTGEWHNNHHLYPGSARAGFLPGQLDLAWLYIFSMYKIGVVSSYHDSKKEFLRKYVNKS